MCSLFLIRCVFNKKKNVCVLVVLKPRIKGTLKKERYPRGLGGKLLLICLYFNFKFVGTDTFCKSPFSLESHRYGLEKLDIGREKRWPCWSLPLLGTAHNGSYIFLACYQAWLYIKVLPWSVINRNTCLLLFWGPLWYSGFTYVPPEDSTGLAWWPPCFNGVSKNQQENK